MNKYVIGIRHKESRSCRGLVVVDDPKSAINDIKASIKANPACAYALFPSDYEIVIKEINLDEIDTIVALVD